MTIADETKNDQPVVVIPDAAAWEDWLDAHHVDQRGVWLKLAKKGAAATTVTYAEAVDGALCFGWIDSQSSSYDEQYWLQRFTPRGPRSRWSQVNQGKVAALIEAGRMRPPGQAAIDAAKANGRWEAAYAPPSTAAVPSDLKAALDADPAAAQSWASLDKTNRYAVLLRIHDARKPETRARRIRTFVEMLRSGEKIYP